MLLYNVFEDPEICNQIGDFYFYCFQGFIRLTDNLGSGSEESSDLSFALVKCCHRISKS